MVTCENFASWFRNLEFPFARWDPSSQVAKSTSHAGLHCDFTAAIHFKFRTLEFQFRKVRNCPSAWCSCLPKAISFSFQIQIIHGLKRWILDFLRFQMVYSMKKMDFGKCSKSAKEDCSCCPLFSLLCFPLLHCSFLAYFERLRQRTMRL